MSPRICGIELLAVGPDHPRSTWSARLGPMYEALIIARLYLDNGGEGLAGLTTYTEHDFDRTTISAARLMAPFVLQQELTEIPRIHADMRARYVPLSHMAVSLFDIALHDAKAREIGLPLYQMLGAVRHKVRAYASSPLLADDDAYIAYCQDMLAQGFRAIKIHPYCRFHDDLRLVHGLNAHFHGCDIGWSLDVDGCYSLDQALRMGRVLDQTGWEFFEAPIPDADLRGYQKLCAALDVDVICGGNSLPDLRLIDLALGMGAWDRSRFDVTGVGGFTGAMHGMAVTHAHGLKCEVQSWGYTLSQAANLHLMLAHDHCDYFEQAAPYEKYEFAASPVIRPDADGYVHPSPLPGLGITMDWPALEPFIYERHMFGHRIPCQDHAIAG